MDVRSFETTSGWDGPPGSATRQTGAPTARSAMGARPGAMARPFWASWHFALRHALGAADFLAARSGFLDRKLDAARLMELARKQTGLEEWGTEAIAEPLQLLLEACAREASLGLIGRMALRWDVLRFLCNLLRLEEAARRQPAISAENIAAPIVITGLPRSGTTFLHQMMLFDPANRAPRVWEVITPCQDRPGAGTAAARDGRSARVAKQIQLFQLLAPEFRDLHPLTATSPQECTEILAHGFRSLRFDTTYRVPSYRAWLDGDEARHLPAYRLHRRFLQHLQYGAGAPRRWVLKCPDHLFALPALKEVYPDARLVFVHRDPLKVLLSVARLTEVLRQPFSRSVDPIEIGRQESTRWREGAARMTAESGADRWREPVCHVHYLDLVADPAATVQAVYRHFGLALPEAAAAAIRRADRAVPRGGYAVHEYRFEDHGLDAAEEAEKFRTYMTHFGITPERSDEPPRASRRPTPARQGGAAEPMAGGLSG